MARRANRLNPPGQPDLASLADLVGDSARARMLTALMGGVALTATELSLEGEISASTASSHLAKLVEAKILAVVRQGRHRYFRLADAEVAAMLETMMGVAARSGAGRRRFGPRDPSLADARVCYDHLAGAKGVWMADRLRERMLLVGRDAFDLGPAAPRFFEALGIDVETLSSSRRPLCRTCLDWSERRCHLGGALGAAILERIFDLGWARRVADRRAVRFSEAGERAFRTTFEEATRAGGRIVGPAVSRRP